MSTSTEFAPADLEQLRARGIDPADAAAQAGYLRNPPPAVVLDRPCAIGDGISRIEGEERSGLVDRGDAAAGAGRVSKFVPASGAATRMFKDLIAALQDHRRPSASPAARELFEQLDAFPFAEELRRLAKVPGRPRHEQDERAILDTMLNRMRYAELPKALIPFHRTDRRRTAFEEQLLEGTRYVRAADGACRMHFTVAPEFRDEFELTLRTVGTEVERRRRGSRLDVGFSEQDPSTDTLAVEADGKLFRLSDGSLLFRPGGHGSLITNLNALSGDIVVIKNVDNILPDETTAQVVRWKRTLIGYLVQIQSDVFDLLAACESDDAPEQTLDRAIAFAAFRFSRRPASELRSREEKRQFVFEALDRPIRVCGVVKNEGEPGGAPFWVTEADGTQSVQIVESSQVNPSDPRQMRIFRSSTHFNPVDIVCGLRSWKGDPYDLRRFVDEGAVFVARKTHEGRDLLALERPGLWNGAMAGWNTVCVEVPAGTFAPVKTVFDLLRPQHQFRSPAARPAAAEEASVGGCVLIVTNDADDQRVLQRLMAGAGFDTKVAAEGDRGLEIARRDDIDLVLLDTLLPGLDGYEVLERLRGVRESAQIPVVLITSADQMAERSRGLDLGAADYVSRPFDRQVVLARVRAHLLNRQLSREADRLRAEVDEQQAILTEDRRGAADIQRALLPANLDTPRLATGAAFQPFPHIGGDVFNVVPLNDRETAAYIVDISGHGVSSALLTVSLTQHLSGPFGLLRKNTDRVSPAVIMRQLEAEYPQERFGKHFSIALFVLDLTSGRYRYCSAGHPAPFVVRSRGSIEHLSAGGPVIGMGLGLPFNEGEGDLQAGDRVVLYTDGITNDESASGERFGHRSLEQFFADHRAEPLGDVCAALLDTLSARRGDAPPSDDLALLALERR